MNARDALREGAAALSGSGTPFLDASLLLAEAAGLEPARLYAAGPEPLDDAAIGRYRASIARRAAGEPVAYILGRREFYGRTFAVDRRVLVPRPDTELLVEAALAAGDEAERRLGRPPRLHEACCGSGCVAVSLAAERPRWAISASDLSPEALEVASANASAILGPGAGAARPGGPLVLFRSDLLEPLVAGMPAGGPYDLALANPPYVPAAEARALAAEWGEPLMALDGGADGLDACRRLAVQAVSRIAPGGGLLLEADGAQAAALRLLLEAAGFVEVHTLDDLGGRPRVTSGRLPAGGGE